MTISIKTHKMLWGRAANRCAHCKRELVIDASETDDESIVGEACHIVAQSEEGPRGKSTLTPEQRDKFANLILLCNVHHKQIDDQPNTFTVEELYKLKCEHETWVSQKLGLDNKKQQDEETYSSYVEEWESRLKLNEWSDWVSDLLMDGQPSLRHETKTAIEDICQWLLSRVWPGRYPDLESAFLNFRLVARDLCSVFNMYAKRTESTWMTAKFYQINEYNEELYSKLLNEYYCHTDLLQDLALELTRAANYICDKVRDCLMSNYRTSEGVLLIEGGPYIGFAMKTYRVEYLGDERVNVPYPGLEQFRNIRFSRDIYFGEAPTISKIV